MTDFDRMVDALMKSGVWGDAGERVAGGALLGSFGGDGARKLGPTALQAGTLAAIGGLAWKAYQAYVNRPQEAAPAAQQQALLPPPAHELLIIRAMIAAAHADRHIDAQELVEIFERIERMELAADDKAMLFDELRRPLGLLELVALTPDTEAGAEVYAASLLAVGAGLPIAERYLADLARRLELPAELVDAVHEEVARA